MRASWNVISLWKLWMWHQLLWESVQFSQISGLRLGSSFLITLCAVYGTTFVVQRNDQWIFYPLTLNVQFPNLWSSCKHIFLHKFQTPVTLCRGELWSILVVRLAHSADLRSRLRHVSCAHTHFSVTNWLKLSPFLSSSSLSSFVRRLFLLSRQLVPFRVLEFVITGKRNI